MILRSPTDNENVGISLHRVLSSTRHSRARGNPGLFSNELAWIPAFAGMTEPRGLVRSADHPRTSIFEGGHEDHEVRKKLSEPFVPFVTALRAYSGPPSRVVRSAYRGVLRAFVVRLDFVIEDNKSRPPTVKICARLENSQLLKVYHHAG